MGVHGITPETYEKIVLDAGQLRIDYVDEANPGALLAATRGGSIIEIKSELRKMIIDGSKGDTKGDKRIASVECSITANIIEWKSWVIKLAAPGSDSYATPTHAEIKRFLLLSLSKYRSSVALLGQVMFSEQRIICVLNNVIGTNGINISFVENDESNLQIVFKGSFTPSMETEPWSIKYPKDEPEPPVRTPAAWWKGEDNFVDSIQPGMALVPWNDRIPERFSNGIIGRCFIINTYDAPGSPWDSLTIGDPDNPEKQYKTNISSFDTWEFEYWLNISEYVPGSGQWFYNFQAYDPWGGWDFVASTIDIDGDYIDVYSYDAGWDYPLWENLNLPKNTWFKIRLKLTKSTNTWELFIQRGIGQAEEKMTPTGSDSTPVNVKDYTTYFIGTNRTNLVLKVDELKIFTDSPAPPTYPYWTDQPGVVFLGVGYTFKAQCDTPVPYSKFRVSILRSHHTFDPEVYREYDKESNIWEIPFSDFGLTIPDLYIIYAWYEYEGQRYMAPTDYRGQFRLYP